MWVWTTKLGSNSNFNSEFGCGNGAVGAGAGAGLGRGRGWGGGVPNLPDGVAVEVREGVEDRDLLGDLVAHPLQRRPGGGVLLELDDELQGLAEDDPGELVHLRK